MRALGDYELVRELGFGGMGSVHLAFKMGGLSKPVAVKIVHPQLARERSFVDMFLEEVRLASLMKHRNVVRVLDVGEAPFVVMEYVSGRHLGEIAERSGPLAPRLVARIIADAARGLDHAHRVGDDEGPLNLIHRDVSPQNILVGYDGSVKVTDFGVAKAERRLSQSTATGRLKGKCAYLAPEQVLGHELDFRADIFALGVVAWELSAGRPLFRVASDAETLMNVVNAEVPELDAPEELAVLIDRALTRDKEVRWESAAAMSAAFEAVAAGSDELESAMLRWFAEEAAEERAAMEQLQHPRKQHPRVPLRTEPTSAPRTHPTQPVTLRDETPSQPRLRWLLAMALGIAAVVTLAFGFGGDSDARTPLAPVAIEVPAVPVLVDPVDAGGDVAEADAVVATVVPRTRPRRHRRERPETPVAPVVEATPSEPPRETQRTCADGVAAYRAGSEARVYADMTSALWEPTEWARTRREWTAGVQRCYEGHDAHHGLTWTMRVDESGQIDMIRPSTACPNAPELVACMTALFSRRPVDRHPGTLRVAIGVDH